ncbi:hypothetical protein SBA4_4580009 [Candidatus Sulfopaludibacter sp. SbA4]|nr:hypothetical protein SBA4_4580009 [Candidatus Sulfopaludibacter sp. SbA4]
MYDLKGASQSKGVATAGIRTICRAVIHMRKTRPRDPWLWPSPEAGRPREDRPMDRGATKS